MSNSYQRFARRLATLALLALAGCGQTASTYDANVQGTVTIDGELAPGGTVTFSPKGDGPAAIGVVGDDGSFVLKVGQGAVAAPNHSLIPSGEYAAAVIVTGAPAPNPNDEVGPQQSGPKLMADKYADKATSGLEFTVKKGANVFELKLDGPSANPPVEEAAEDAAPEEEAATDAAEPAEPADAASDDAAATDDDKPADAEAAAESDATTDASAAPPANESETPASSGEEAKQ